MFSSCDYCGHVFTLDFDWSPIMRYGYVLHQECWALIFLDLQIGHYIYKKGAYYTSYHEKI